MFAVKTKNLLLIGVLCVAVLVAAIVTINIANHDSVSADHRRCLYRANTSQQTSLRICSEILPGRNLSSTKCYLATGLMPGPDYEEISCTDPRLSDPDHGGATPGTGTRFGGNCEARPMTVANCGILNIIVTITKVLSALVGIIIVIMLAIGGIQYSASRDKPDKVQAAKGHIANTLLALLLYMFTMAFLQWIIPGGILQ